MSELGGEQTEIRQTPNLNPLKEEAREKFKQARSVALQATTLGAAACLVMAVGLTTEFSEATPGGLALFLFAKEKGGFAVKQAAESARDLLISDKTMAKRLDQILEATPEKA
tara:strand:+ start:140 stop:475 length:336 start_codon:yes stop_codon:yes gene_type:complete